MGIESKSTRRLLAIKTNADVENPATIMTVAKAYSASAATGDIIARKPIRSAFILVPVIALRPDES
jgi:hypothetical protein